MSTRIRGRPTVFSNDVVHKLEQAFAIGCTVEEACLLSGVSRSAYYNRLEANTDFMDRMERSKLYMILRARQVVYNAIANGDAKIALWYLERKRRDEFGTCKHTYTNNDRDFDNCTDNELLKLSSPKPLIV